jgi:8-oxo-dGTP pyrophosphatase MutT (NUDIX family)
VDDVGHTPLQTAVAELKEELGLDVAPEAFISFAETTKDEAQQNGTLRDREFHSNYMVYADVDIATLKMQAHEVGDLAWMPIEEYRAVIASNDPTHVHHTSLPAFFDYIDAHKK